MSNNTPQKKKEGRPTKLIPQVISAIETVVEENILVCTDKELIMLVNEELEEDEQISYRVFKDWKNGYSQTDNPLYPQFLSVIKRALIKEKKSLFKKYEKAKPGEWQKYAWILERKFDEWNLTKKQDINHSVSEQSKKPWLDGTTE